MIHTKDTAFSALDSEAAALGAAIGSPSALTEVLTLTVEDFYDARHRAIYEAVRRLYKEHRAVDMASVVGALDGAGAFEGGAFSYLVDICAAAIPSATHIHTAEIRKAARRRAVYRAAQALMGKAGRYDTDPDEAVSEFAVSLRSMNNGIKLVSCEEGLLEFCDRLESMQKGNKEKRAYTGIPALDEQMGGFFGPKMIVIGARPGTGKTAFSLGIAMETSRRGYRTLYFNLEMKTRDMIARSVANLASIDVGKVDQGNLTPDEFIKAGGVYQDIANMKITWAPDSNTPDKIRAAVVQANKDNDLACIIVDYVRYMRSGVRTASQREEMSEISRALVGIAHEFDIPVVPIVQVNRDSQKTGTAGSTASRAPTMAELRDTGAWEEDADAIFLLFAPDDNTKLQGREKEAYEQCKANRLTYVQIEAAKVRQGQKGKYHAIFDGAHMRYRRMQW